MKILLNFILFMAYILVFEPFLHEMGHAFALVKYENYAAVSFYIPFVRKMRINIKNIEFFNVKNKNFKNITYSRSNFMDLDEMQIINVASAGPRASIIHLIIVLILSVIFRLYILLGFMLFMLGIFFHAKFFQKEYNDFKIKNNPESFIRRIEEYPADSEMRYENLIKEYEK